MAPMYAVIQTGGKQYKVVAGEKIKVEQIVADVGQEITLDQVLAVGSGADLTPERSVADMRRTLAALTPADNGRFVNHDGTPIVW